MAELWPAGVALSGWCPVSLRGGPDGDKAEGAQLLGASHRAEAGLSAAWSLGPRGEQCCVSSRAPRGQRRAEHWAREEGGVGGWARAQEVCFQLVPPRLFNLSPGVTGWAAAPLQRPFPGRCLGRRRKTLAETRWGGSEAGGVPRLAVRPAVRGQEMTRPVAVLLR